MQILSAIAPLKNYKPLNCLFLASYPGLEKLFQFQMESTIFCMHIICIFLFFIHLEEMELQVHCSPGVFRLTWYTGNINGVWHATREKVQLNKKSVIFSNVQFRKDKHLATKWKIKIEKEMSQYHIEYLRVCFT